MRVPNIPAGQQPHDGWIDLHQVVLWVAYRGAPIPKYGSEDFDNGIWIDHGDRDFEDQEKVRVASNDVRVALSTARIQAMGMKEGVEQPQSIEPGYWAFDFGMTISDWRIRFDGFRWVKLPDWRVKELWPATSKTSAKDWIATYQGRNGKTAWADYQIAFPSGRRVTKSTFEKEWNAVHGRGRGRPSSKSP